MSSFDTLESSRESSRPIEVYTIAIGAETFRYTSAEDEVTIGLLTYEPLAIARSEIGQSGDDSSRTLTITLPPDNPFARKYILIAPGQKATVSIVRLQRDESPAFNTQVLIFKGQVLSVRFPQDGEAAELIVRSLESALRRNIPRHTYMGMCNHVLYGPGCGVDPSAFTNTGTVSAVSGTVITIPGLNVRPDQFFRGGFCKPATEQDFRLILDHVGNTITVLLPFATNVLGASLQVFAGCDHKFDGHCATKFDNVIEFGGFPYVPTKNLFETGL